MLSSVTELSAVFVAIIIAMSMDLRFGEAESGGWAAVYVVIESLSGADDRVEKMPRQSSGQTLSR